MKEEQNTPPTINSTSLPEGTINQHYGMQVNVSGKRPIEFYISDGNLPEGLDINSESGLIFGTPTESGIFTFTMRANNEMGEDEKEFTLIINEQKQPPVITYASLPNAVYGEAYSETIKCQGALSLLVLI